MDDCHLGYNTNFLKQTLLYNVTFTILQINIMPFFYKIQLV
jgi:hypothetical protein